MSPPPSRTELLEQLLDLAYDVSSYLRHQARPVIRVSAALLVAASLAACSAGGASDAPAPAPIDREVKTGLPTQPGFYPIVDGSLARDSRGVYHFSWLEPGGSGPGTPASVSLVRLARSDTNRVEIHQTGDPTLHLRQDAPVALASTASDTGYTGYRSGGYVHWYPFPVGGGYYGPGYYDPPSRTMPSSGTVAGSNVASQPRPPSERTYAVSSAVSGRAGGTGSGTAATSKSGADFSSGGKSGTTSSVGGKSSVAPAKSSGFSSGGSSSGGSSASSGG